MNIIEKALRLKQDVDDVYNAGKLNPLAISESLNGNVSGAVVAVNDVSDISHNIGCKVESKNLLDPRIYVDTSNRGAVHIFDDGLVELDGGLDMENRDTYAEITYGFIVAEPCVLTLYYDYGVVNAYLNNTWLNTIDEDIISTPLSVGAYNLRLYQNDQSYSGTYIQLEKGIVATPYTPYVEELGGIEVSRYGKNLLPTTVSNLDNWEQGKIPNDAESRRTYPLNMLTANNEYTISLKIKEDAPSDNGYLYLKHSNDNWNTSETFTTLVSGVPTNMPFTFIAQEGYEYKLWWYSIYSRDTFEDYYYDLQLELGASATPYEPYIEPTTYTANADGTVEGVTSIAPNMTLLTNNNGAIINCNYYKDPDIVISNLQQSIALSGGV